MCHHPSLLFFVFFLMLKIVLKVGSSFVFKFVYFFLCLCGCEQMFDFCGTEMVQWGKTAAAKPHDPSSILKIHVVEGENLVLKAAL